MNILLSIHQDNLFSLSCFFLHILFYCVVDNVRDLFSKTTISHIIRVKHWYELLHAARPTHHRVSSARASASWQCGTLQTVHCWGRWVHPWALSSPDGPSVSSLCCDWKYRYKHIKGVVKLLWKLKIKSSNQKNQYWHDFVIIMWVGFF